MTMCSPFLHHWANMIDDALEPAELNDRRMIVVHVGGGTGLSTLGIVKHDVSAGSIEYWPEPQRGIKEAYRVLKLGGKACVIGPVYPTFWLSRFFADVFMLFPKEEEYIQWFEMAGFQDVQLKRIGPKWYRGVRRHGLILGCSVTGVKPASGDSPLKLGPKAEDVSAPVKPLAFLTRLILGTLAAIYYALLPIYMWLKDLITPKGQPI